MILFLLRQFGLCFLLVLALGACGAPLPPERSLELVVTAEGYQPDTITVSEGEQVFIRFINEDTVGHNVTIEFPTGDRSVSAEPGVDAVLTFPARTVGEFRFYCAVPGHTEEGVLIVTP